MDRNEIDWEVVDWIDVARGRENWSAVVKKVMNLRVP